MNKAQPQYLIKANRNCKTHRVGTQIVFTGARSTVCAGWSVIRKVNARVD